MDNRSSLDRSSADYAQMDTPVNAPMSSAESSLPLDGESPKGQQSVNELSPAVDSVLQSDVCLDGKTRLRIQLMVLFRLVSVPCLLA